MPRWIALNKSGVHRAACFALYRALLRQRQRLPLPEQQQLVFGSKAKKEFRKNVKIQSPTDVIAALRLGYATLETLGKPASKWPDTLTYALGPKALQSKVPKPRPAPNVSNPPTRPTPQPLRKPRPTKPRLWPHPAASPVLSRPFKAISGRRHIPHLVNANGVPFLRIQKPQSPFLGRMIRSTIRGNEHRLLRTREMEDLLSFANDENKWDRILQGICGIAGHEGGGWEKCVKETLEDMGRRGKLKLKRRAVRARTLWGIVVEERRLAEEERMERRRKRRRERLAKKEVKGQE